VRPAMAHREVNIKIFSVIYELPKLVSELIAQQFASQTQAAQKGELAVLGVFSKSKEGQVIGGKAVKAVIKKGMTLNIKRDEEIIGKGKIINLQHLKKDVTVVEAGKECGILFQGDEVKVGDVLIEAF